MSLASADMAGLGPGRQAKSAGIARPGTAEDARIALPVILFIFSILVPFAFNAGPVLLNGVRIVLLVMTVPLFFQLVSGRFGKLIIPDYFLFFHVIWMALAVFANNPDRVVEHVGVSGMEIFGGYLLGRAYIRTRAQFLRLVKGVAWVIVLMLPLAIYETQTGRPFIIEALRSLPGITSYQPVFADKRLGLERVQGSFAHPIHFGLFCAMVMPVCYFAFQESMARTPRLFLTAFTFLSAFLGLSSGVILALVAQIILISWYLLLINVKQRWAIMAGLFVAAYVAIDVASTRDPLRVFMSYATFSSHTAYWRSIIFEWGWMNIFGSVENNIPAAPLFGIGLKEWIRPPYMFSGSMDNFWLVVGVRYGVPGAVSVMVAYFWALWKIGRRTGLEGDKELLDIRRGWMFVFVGLAFTLATVHIWTSLYAYVFFFFGAGMWLLTAEPRGAEGAGDPALAGSHMGGDMNGDTGGGLGPYSRFPIAARSRDPKPPEPPEPRSPRETQAHRGQSARAVPRPPHHPSRGSATTHPPGTAAQKAGAQTGPQKTGRLAPRHPPRKP